MTTRRDLAQVTQAGQGYVLSVPPGTYRLVASTEDGLGGEARVRVGALDSATAEITLR